MMSMSTSQNVLNQMLLNGRTNDPQFAELLLLLYYNDVYRLSCSILTDEQDAQDAAQDTFIDALAQIERFQPGTNLKAWLAKIAVHKCQAILRKRRTWHSLHSALQAVHNMFTSQPAVMETVLQNEVHDNLWKAVNDLGEKHRIPLILFYVYDLSIKEIAETLQLKQGTVNSRLHYAIEKLRGLIQIKEALQREGKNWKSGGTDL
jgi:RNA polymerase sigma-70 factor (ECF subfamily)